MSGRIGTGTGTTGAQAARQAPAGTASGRATGPSSQAAQVDPALAALRRSATGGASAARPRGEPPKPPLRNELKPILDAFPWHDHEPPSVYAARLLTAGAAGHRAFGGMTLGPGEIGELVRHQRNDTHPYLTGA